MWTLIRTQADWTEYQIKTARELMVTDRQIDWGKGPRAYPCLACTHMPPRPSGSEPRLYTAYVYEREATELVRAAGKQVHDPDVPRPPSQHQFNRLTAAQLLAVAYFLIETGIATEDKYQAKILEMLDLVDDRAKAASVPAYARDAVASVRPA